MTGDDFIALASRLLLSSVGDPETRHRTAVSRGYYGAFHLAIQFLAELGLRIPKNHTGHQRAYELLLNSGSSDAEQAARLLADLRTVRNEADYDLNKRRLASQASAKADVEMAASFQTALRRCDDEAVKSKIMAAIRPTE